MRDALGVTVEEGGDHLRDLVIRECRNRDVTASAWATCSMEPWLFVAHTGMLDPTSSSVRRDALLCGRKIVRSACAPA